MGFFFLRFYRPRVFFEIDFGASAIIAIIVVCRPGVFVWDFEVCNFDRYVITHGRFEFQEILGAMVQSFFFVLLIKSIE